MDAADKRMLEREALRNMIQQWNANRLDLFALSEPNENLEFHGVMRFYFQDSGQKIATKCIRVASDATVSDVIETLIEKFRPDMRMLSLGSYSLWETHGPDDERKLEPDEKPLLVQLNWHAEDREGRFLLKCLTGNEIPSSASDKGDQNFKRKLSKREKKELKKKEKASRMKSDATDENRPAEKLYNELPESSFMRSISNPEAVMRRRRQQKLGRKLQQFKSKDGGPDTGGTLRIYGGILRPDVSYITLLLSINDNAAMVLRETLDKYAMGHHDPLQYCIVQEDKSDNTEYILEDDECPLALMNMTRSSIMFHVRRRPADSQPRRRKKKAGANGTNSRPGNDPVLVETTPDATPLENGRRLRVTEALEVGSGNGTALQLYGPSIQSRHCVVAPAEGGGYTVTPLHPDALVYVNGQRISHTQRLQHGCLLKFGRVSTFRFMDPAQENLINRNLSQSQHYGSGSIYDRSPTSPGETSGAMSPTSLASQPAELDANANADADADADYLRTVSPGSQDAYYRDADNLPYNNNTLKLDNESIAMSHLTDPKDDNARDEHSVSTYTEQEQSANRTTSSHYKDNYETTFDLEGNVETKSICSAKSGGSGHDNRMSMRGGGGQEAILPAVLEFPEGGQGQFLAAVISRLDPHAPAFKLAPVYTLYLCARYRASTHYRPELTPTERAHKLTAFLHHVAYLIHATVQERSKHSAAQAFWMANASELLHFLKYDRHISSFSTQAQELLSQTVEAAFSNLVSCFQAELTPALEVAMSARGEASEATAATLQALAAAVVLLRLCRVNAALTLQLFSSLFYYINSYCFNKLVTEPGMANPQWGAALTARLALLSAWALRQGSEIAADCHLAKIYQAAQLIQRTYRTPGEVVSALTSCSKLNSVQVRALLAPLAPPDVVEAAVAHARSLADELCRADGREVRLEESTWLCVELMIPCGGFSAEVVRGVPPGLAEFVAPLQRAQLCRLAHQPHARGDWAVYLCRAPPARPDPRPIIVQLHKNSNGMGLSIVAAKGSGQSKLGIYIKSVVPGGAAAADGRLAAGDQLLSVDGQSLVGITQEKAAEYLVRTGPTVTLEVAKQGAMLHGLATLLHQPAYNNQRPGPGGNAARRASERDLPSRLAAEPVKPSKSTPALHQVVASPPTLAPHPAHVTHTSHPPPPSASTSNVSDGNAALWAHKSRSSHNLTAPNDAFYQNLSSVHAHPMYMQPDRWSSLRSSTGSNRPHSAHYAARAHQADAPESPMQLTNQTNAMNARAAKLAEMSEEVSRREQAAFHSHRGPPPHSLHNHAGQMQQAMHPGPSPQQQQQLHQLQQLHHQQQQQQQHHQQQIQQNTQQHLQSPGHHQHAAAATPQRYDWHQPLSPQRSQPPVAPKPQQMPRRPEAESDEFSQTQTQQPQPQSSTIEPDEERYVASALDMPGGAGAGGAYLAEERVRAPAHAHAHNPWQREEHERQAEARRAAARARRDAMISQLVSLGGARSPAQSQQLRALQLERDFELRASLHDQEERGAADGDVEDEEHITPEPPSPAPLPASAAAPSGPAPHPSPLPPKSILKTNRTEVTNGYAQEAPPALVVQTSSREDAHPWSDAAALSHGYTWGSVPPAPEAPPAAAAPAPPARGSSFTVMATRARALSSPPNELPTPQSPVRDKRVSFHAGGVSGGAGGTGGSPAPPAPPSTSPPPLEREDPDRFLQEAEALMASPTTPTTPNAPTHTPGVIGAQEVYKDPRTRRLAEAMARAPAQPIPEQLSFKDKMKMFALESGEASTPKDKVKISRAQRDIDAVH